MVSCWLFFVFTKNRLLLFVFYLFLFNQQRPSFLRPPSLSKATRHPDRGFFFLSSPAPLEVVSILHGLLRLRGLGPAVPLRKAGALDRSRRRSPEILKRGRHRGRFWRFPFSARGKKGRGLFREFGLRL